MHNNITTIVSVAVTDAVVFFNINITKIDNFIALYG